MDPMTESGLSPKWVQGIFWAGIATGIVLPVLVFLVVRVQGRLGFGLDDMYSDVLITTIAFAAPFVAVAFWSRSQLKRAPGQKTLLMALGAYVGVTLGTAWLLFYYWTSGAGALMIIVPVPLFVGCVASLVGGFLGWVVYSCIR